MSQNEKKNETTTGNTAERRSTGCCTKKRCMFFSGASGAGIGGGIGAAAPITAPVVTITYGAIGGTILAMMVGNFVYNSCIKGDSAAPAQSSMKDDGPGM
jgi:hypothetical protein